MVIDPSVTALSFFEGYFLIDGYSPETPRADQPVAAIRFRISDTLAESISDTSTP
jgi:hypothetical protein